MIIQRIYHTDTITAAAKMATLQDHPLVNCRAAILPADSSITMPNDPTAVAANMAALQTEKTIGNRKRTSS